MSNTKKPKKVSKALTWDEIADMYNLNTGLRARAKPMDEVFDYVAAQTEKIWAIPEGTLHTILRQL